MASLPIPAKIYFSDFSFDLIDYEVNRNLNEIGNFKGLKSKDENGRYIGFLIDADIQINDVLKAMNETFIIRNVSYDHYNGIPEMIKAYY